MARAGQRRSYLSALAFVLCVVAPACKPRSKPTEDRPALGQVQVKPIPAVELLGRSVSLDERALQNKITAQLAQSGVFDPGASARATATVTLEALPFAEGSVEAIEIGIKLRLRLTLRPEGRVAARFTEDVAAVGQAPLASPSADGAQQALQRLAERTADDLVRGYIDRQNLWTGQATVVAAALASTDTDLKTEALRVVGARRLHQLAPTVMRLLVDEDEGIRDAALGAVVALRDRSAVKTLATSRQMRDTREMRKVVHAMAVLGGAEARDYLAFVAETHDDEEIRGLAKGALDRLGSQSAHPQPTK